MINQNILIKIQLIILLSLVISYSTLPSSGDMACCDPAATSLPCYVECCAAIGWTISICDAFMCDYCQCISMYYDPYSGEDFEDHMFFACGSVWWD